MKRYWDLEEHERAALTEDELTGFIDLELMERGFLKPKPPQLETINPVNLDRKTYWGIFHKTAGYDQSLGIAFETEADATTFMNIPKVYQSEWEYSCDAKYARLVTGINLQKVDLTTEQFVIDAKETLVSNKKKKDRNDKLKNEYSQASKVVQAETEELINDWHRCQSLIYKYQRILETFREYKGMAEDADVAMRFLRKVYDETEIGAALEWEDLGGAR